MSDLQLSSNTVLTMTSLEISELVNSRHDNVRRTIERLADSAVIVLPPMEEVKNHLNQKILVYKVDQRSSYIIVAQLSPEFTARLVDRWQELEAQAQQPQFQIPQTYPEALQLAADQAKEIESQKQQIEEYKPKALFADAVSTSHTTILVGELAKLICQNGVKIGSSRLFDYLRENGFLIKRKGTDWNMPTQYSMERKLFEIRERSIVNSDGSTRLTRTPKVTGKGQVYFVNRFVGKEGTA